MSQVQVQATRRILTSWKKKFRWKTILTKTSKRGEPVGYPTLIRELFIFLNLTGSEPEVFNWRSPLRTRQFAVLIIFSPNEIILWDVPKFHNWNDFGSRWLILCANGPPIYRRFSQTSPWHAPNEIETETFGFRVRPRTRKHILSKIIVASRFDRFWNVISWP